MNTPMPPSLHQIASCVSGYDPNALPVAQAREFIARLVPRVQTVEKMALRSALGRVLARDIRSAINVPSHDNSAMDGYALRASELRDDGETFPILTCAGGFDRRIQREQVGLGGEVFDQVNDFGNLLEGFTQAFDFFGGGGYGRSNL